MADVQITISCPVNASFSLPNGGSASVYLPNVEGDQRAALVDALQNIIAELVGDEE